MIDLTAMARWCLVALSGVILADTSRHGTAIAALRNTHEIAIAVDSRIVDRLGMQMPDACKLRVVGDTAIAVHGLAEDEASDFNLFQLAVASLTPAADLSTTIKRLAASAVGPLTRAVSRVLDEDPLMLRAPGLKANPAGVVLARYEHGTPRLGYVRFVVHPGTTAPITLTAEQLLCPGDCPTGVGAVLVAPDQEASATFEHWHPDYWKHDLGPTAVGFVQTQLEGPFPDIGPPIDALHIVNGHISWLARKASCPEQG